MNTTSGTHTLPTLPVAIKSLTTEQANRLDATFPGLPRPDNCITCRGAKTFRWYERGDHERTGGLVTYTCSCNDQFTLHRRLLYCGVYENFQRLSWDDFVEIPDDVVAATAEYIEHSGKYVDAGFGMVIHGDKGNGKTMLANLVIKALIAKGFNCYASTFISLIDAFADGWRDREDKDWFSQRVRNADVLLIDDLGRERNKGGSDLGERTLEEVIRHRIARSKPTLITTNKTIEGVNLGYGGHVASLLSERSDHYRFSGADRRGEMNQRTKSEILLGATRPIVLE